eukprot:GDKJ01032813.1.p1 GENE.GDKJ01032813.1~~GDKJ01032813.1.p1  ORF type:complete len:1534 (+),score=353.78 GDKJ01032813.1:639-4604(+)
MNSSSRTFTCRGDGCHRLELAVSSFLPSSSSSPSTVFSSTPPCSLTPSNSITNTTPPPLPRLSSKTLTHLSSSIMKIMQRADVAIMHATDVAAAKLLALRSQKFLPITLFEHKVLITSLMQYLPRSDTGLFLPFHISKLAECVPVPVVACDLPRWMTTSHHDLAISFLSVSLQPDIIGKHFDSTDSFSPLQIDNSSLNHLKGGVGRKRVGSLAHDLLGLVCVSTILTKHQASTMNQESAKNSTSSSKNIGSISSPPVPNSSTSTISPYFTLDVFLPLSLPASFSFEPKTSEESKQEKEANSSATGETATIEAQKKDSGKNDNIKEPIDKHNLLPVIIKNISKYAAAIPSLPPSCINHPKDGTQISWMIDWLSASIMPIETASIPVSLSQRNFNSQSSTVRTSATGSIVNRSGISSPPSCLVPPPSLLSLCTPAPSVSLSTPHKLLSTNASLTLLTLLLSESSSITATLTLMADLWPNRMVQFMSLANLKFEDFAPHVLTCVMSRIALSTQLTMLEFSHTLLNGNSSSLEGTNPTPSGRALLTTLQSLVNRLGWFNAPIAASLITPYQNQKLNDIAAKSLFADHGSTPNLKSEKTLSPLIDTMMRLADISASCSSTNMFIPSSQEGLMSKGMSVQNNNKLGTVEDDIFISALKCVSSLNRVSNVNSIELQQQTMSSLLSIDQSGPGLLSQCASIVMQNPLLAAIMLALSPSNALLSNVGCARLTSFNAHIPHESPSSALFSPSIIYQSVLSWTQLLISACAIGSLPSSIPISNADVSWLNPSPLTVLTNGHMQTVTSIHHAAFVRDGLRTCLIYSDTSNPFAYAQSAPSNYQVAQQQNAFNSSIISLIVAAEQSQKLVLESVSRVALSCMSHLHDVIVTSLTLPHLNLPPSPPPLSILEGSLSSSVGRLLFLLSNIPSLEQALSNISLVASHLEACSTLSAAIHSLLCALLSAKSEVVGAPRINRVAFFSSIANQIVQLLATTAQSQLSSIVLNLGKEGRGVTASMRDSQNSSSYLSEAFSSVSYTNASLMLIITSLISSLALITSPVNEIFSEEQTQQISLNILTLLTRDGNVSSHFIQIMTLVISNGIVKKYNPELVAIASSSSMQNQNRGSFKFAAVSLLPLPSRLAMIFNSSPSLLSWYPSLFPSSLPVTLFLPPTCHQTALTASPLLATSILVKIAKTLPNSLPEISAFLAKSLPQSSPHLSPYPFPIISPLVAAFSAITTLDECDTLISVVIHLLCLLFRRPLIAEWVASEPVIVQETVAALVHLVSVASARNVSSVIAPVDVACSGLIVTLVSSLPEDAQLKKELVGFFNATFDA